MLNNCPKCKHKIESMNDIRLAASELWNNALYIVSCMHCNHIVTFTSYKFRELQKSPGALELIISEKWNDATG